MERHQYGSSDLSPMRGILPKRKTFKPTVEKFRKIPKKRGMDRKYQLPDDGRLMR